MSTRPQAIITGGTRGIGRAICLELAATHDIAFTYLSSSGPAEELVKELSSKGARAKAYKADMADAPALEKAFEEILKDFRLVYFRKHTHNFNAQYQEKSHDIVFRIGFQANNEKGENIQRIMEIN